MVKALVALSLDVTVEIDKTAVRFSAAMYSSFVDNAQKDDVIEACYQSRSLKSVKASFDIIAAKVQMLLNALRHVSS